MRLYLPDAVRRHARERPDAPAVTIEVLQPGAGLHAGPVRLRCHRTGLLRADGRDAPMGERDRGRYASVLAS